jgi:hypothetical protein
MKNCFMIIGPESSGTRMLTRIFIDSGCIGSDDHDQFFDSAPPLEEMNVVWRRSIPHGGIKEPNIEEMYNHLISNNYNITIIVISRDIFCTIFSQIQNNHVENKHQSIENIQNSFLFLFNLIKKLNAKYFMINYESLILHKDWTIDNLSKLINFNLKIPDIKNENVKWIDKNKD